MRIFTYVDSSPTTAPNHLWSLTSTQVCNNANSLPNVVKYFEYQNQYTAAGQTINTAITSINTLYGSMEHEQSLTDDNTYGSINEVRTFYNDNYADKATLDTPINGVANTYTSEYSFIKFYQCVAESINSCQQCVYGTVSISTGVIGQITGGLNTAGNGVVTAGM